MNGSAYADAPSSARVTFHPCLMAILQRSSPSGTGSGWWLVLRVHVDLVLPRLKCSGSFQIATTGTRECDRRLIPFGYTQHFPALSNRKVRRAFRAQQSQSLENSKCELRGRPKLELLTDETFFLDNESNRQSRRSQKPAD